LGSAFVTGAGFDWTWIPPFVCLLAAAELVFGSGRLIIIFLAGHVGATLLIAVGLLIAVDAGTISSTVMQAEDVGVSYGAAAVAGALIMRLPAEWRTPAAILGLTFAVYGVLAGQTFTNAGHLTAFVIGLGAALIPGRRSVSGLGPLSRPAIVLMMAGVIYPLGVFIA
jgi:hypothetical protein